MYRWTSVHPRSASEPSLVFRFVAGYGGNSKPRRTAGPMDWIGFNSGGEDSGSCHDAVTSAGTGNVLWWSFGGGIGSVVKVEYSQRLGRQRESKSP